jgi:hypothetical protein
MQLVHTHLAINSKLMFAFIGGGVILHYNTSQTPDHWITEKTMLPLTRNRKNRVSNRLAAFAALLLVVTSLAGVGGSSHSRGSESILQTVALAAEEEAALLPSGNTTKAKTNKGFKKSLFLFRNY